MNNQIETRFTRDYKVQYPIGLAPMAFVGTTPDLAIAVCNAGGVGSLRCRAPSGGGHPRPHQGRQTATNGPLNVNFITILANEKQIQRTIVACNRWIPLASLSVPIKSFLLSPTSSCEERGRRRKCTWEKCHLP
jgi:NAD(P)H-dependent flavin oxidoreductase YrpB (nitropropane dioxygenase family)